MEDDKETRSKKSQARKYYGCSSGGDAVYGLGLIGAAIYFVGQATTFWGGVLGLLKALVWPAYFVYEALGFLLK